MYSRKAKTKPITTANQKQGKHLEEPMSVQSKNNARENVGDQDVIGFSFASDWLTRFFLDQSQSKMRQNQRNFRLRSSLI